MNAVEIKIPTNTLAELRGVLVRALSRENLSFNDKIAIRKTHSSSSLKTRFPAYDDSGKSLAGIKKYIIEIKKQ